MRTEFVCMWMMKLSNFFNEFLFLSNWRTKNRQMSWHAGKFRSFGVQRFWEISYENLFKIWAVLAIGKIFSGQWVSFFRWHSNHFKDLYFKDFKIVAIVSCWGKCNDFALPSIPPLRIFMSRRIYVLVSHSDAVSWTECALSVRQRLRVIVFWQMFGLDLLQST